MVAVSLRAVSKRFGDHDALSDISLEIEDGSFVAFVGPSGCGKSTLLRVIAGLEAANGGEILFGGIRMNEVPAPERGAAMVFQSYALYPHMTVWENMSFSLRLTGKSRDERRRRAGEVARMLDLEPLLDRKPAELSGGQRQRVAIGRAILRHPRLFLFDEPLSNLDASLRGQMRIELADLHARLGATMIYVTHDQIEAMTMADRIVVLKDGRVEQVGSPMELYERPVTPFVAGFIGSPRMNLVEGEAARALGCEVYGIRPEHLALSATEGLWPARVRHVERLGADTIVHMTTEAVGPLVARVDGSRSIAPGDTLHATPNPERELRFH